MCVFRGPPNETRQNEAIASWVGKAFFFTIQARNCAAPATHGDVVGPLSTTLPTHSAKLVIDRISDTRRATSRKLIPCGPATLIAWGTPSAALKLAAAKPIDAQVGDAISPSARARMRILYLRNAHGKPQGIEPRILDRQQVRSWNRMCAYPRV